MPVRTQQHLLAACLDCHLPFLVESASQEFP